MHMAEREKPTWKGHSCMTFWKRQKETVKRPAVARAEGQTNGQSPEDVRAVTVLYLRLWTYILCDGHFSLYIRSKS